jgi:hypothetical protein
VKPEDSAELPRPDPCGARLVVGRLIEVWLNDIRTVEEWSAFMKPFRRAIAAAPGRLVICADYRGLRVLTPAVAEAVLAGFTTQNPRLERSAILLPKRSHTLRLQVDRLVREAKDPNRRTCIYPAEAEAWLAPHLNDDERARLTLFLGRVA